MMSETARARQTITERVAASIQQWGKPTDLTFRFLEDRLRLLAAGGDTNATAAAPPAMGPERFYIVGDNPASDMEGARRANIFHSSEGAGAASGAAAPRPATSWSGVLVRTGVFKARSHARARARARRAAAAFR